MSKRCWLVYATAIAAVASVGHAEAPGTNSITAEEAEMLVAQIDEVATELKRNSTCTLTHDHVFSEKGCDFHLLSVSCTPGVNESGLLRHFAVNKINADVESIDRDRAGRLEEPKLKTLQQQLLHAHGVSSEAASAARDISLVGCFYS